MKKISVFILISFVLLSFLPSCRLKGQVTEKETYTGIVLNYYKFGDSRDTIDPIIAEYVQQKKGLQINYKPFDDFENYLGVVVNEMAEGAGPDIFSMPNTWFASNYKKLKSMPAEFGTITDFDSLFVDVASRDLVQVDIDGIEKVFGIPMTIDTLAIYYNKSHFEDRIPAQGRPSNTWEGIAKDVVALNKLDFETGIFDVSGIAMGIGSNVNYAVDIFYALLLQAGIDFYDETMSMTKFVSSKSAFGVSLIDVLKLYSSFADFSQRQYSWNLTMADSFSESKEIEAFVKGKVSMIFGYSSTYQKIQKEISDLKNFSGYIVAKDDVRVAPFPQLRDPNTTGSKRVTYANYFAEGVSRNSEHEELAWDFLVFLTQKQNLANYFEKTKKPTSRRDMIEEQLKDPIYGVFVSQNGFAESFPIVDTLKFKTVFEKMLDFIAEGGDIGRAYREAEEKLNKLFPALGYRTLKKIE